MSAGNHSAGAGRGGPAGVEHRAHERPGGQVVLIHAPDLGKDRQPPARDLEIIISIRHARRVVHPGGDLEPRVANQPLWIDDRPIPGRAQQQIVMLKIPVQQANARRIRQQRPGQLLSMRNQIRIDPIGTRRPLEQRPHPLAQRMQPRRIWIRTMHRRRRFSRQAGGASSRHRDLAKLRAGHDAFDDHRAALEINIVEPGDVLARRQPQRGGFGTKFIPPMATT